MKPGPSHFASAKSTAKSSVKTAAVISAACAMVFGTAQSASAQTAASLLPGASSSGAVVVTDSPRVEVNVGANNGGDTVEVSIVNKYDSTFSCYAPGVSADEKKPAKLPNSVTEAQIVAKAVDYYRTWPNVPSDGVNVPLLGVVPTNGLLEFAPDGLLGSALGKQITARASLFREWEQAKIAGHNGEIPVFDLKPGATRTESVKLNAPGNGQRKDFDAAALIYCTDNNDSHKQQYVFAGYETGKAPKTSGIGGSLGSPGIPSPSLKTSY